MNGTSSGTALSEDLLVEQARQGQLNAYNQLVLANQALAYSVAHRLLGDGDAAADAVQDSFLKAYRRLDQYSGHQSYFRAWLLRIVINTCYDVLRRRQRQWGRVVAIEEEAGDYEWRGALRDRSEMPEEYVLRRELAERIEAAIERLPVDQRTVLVLSDVEGLQYQEIAEITGVAIGTVKSRLARARARVRHRLSTERHGLAAAARARVSGSSRGAAIAGVE